MKIIRNPGYYHRDQLVIAEIEDSFYSIDKIDCFCVQLSTDEKWWIIAWTAADDSVFTDRGPYDSPEDAFAFIRLYGDPSENIIITSNT